MSGPPARELPPVKSSKLALKTGQVGVALKRHVDEGESEPAAQPFPSAVRDDNSEPSSPRSLPDLPPQAPASTGDLPEGLTTIREVADYLASRVDEAPLVTEDADGEVDADWDAGKLLRESVPQVRSSGPQLAGKALGRMRSGL